MRINQKAIEAPGEKRNGGDFGNIVLKTFYVINKIKNENK